MLSGEILKPYLHLSSLLAFLTFGGHIAVCNFDRLEHGDNKNIQKLWVVINKFLISGFAWQDTNHVLPVESYSWNLITNNS